MPFQPPLFMQTKPHVEAFVAQTLLSQRLLSLNVEPSLHVQLNDEHSSAFAQGSPGALDAAQPP